MLPCGHFSSTVLKDLFLILGNAVLILWYVYLASPSISIFLSRSIFYTHTHTLTHSDFYFMCLQTGMLLYKNRLNGAIVLDLRPRVNLGGGLYNVSTAWQDLTAGNQYTAANNVVQWTPSLFRRHINEHDQDTPILICSNCCTNQLIYFLVPQLITHCPLCRRFMNFFA